VLEVLPFENERVLGLRIRGKITDADMQRMIETAEMKLVAVGKGTRLRVYVEVESLAGIELEALVKDLRFGLSHLRDFERKAVVSDKAWMGRLSRIVAPLFPSIEVRHFHTGERDAARAWVVS